MHSILTTQVGLQDFPVPPLPWHQRFNFLQFCRLFLRQPQQPESEGRIAAIICLLASWSSPRHRSCRCKGGVSPVTPHQPKAVWGPSGREGRVMRWRAVGQGSSGVSPTNCGWGLRQEADYRGVGPLCMQGAGLEESRRPLSHLHSHRQLELDDQLGRCGETSIESKHSLWALAEECS